MLCLEEEKYSKRNMDLFYILLLLLIMDDQYG
jgi:hypothetical protein